jgi:hypothetical protein
MKEMGVGLDGDEGNYENKSATCESGWGGQPRRRSLPSVV